MLTYFSHLQKEIQIIKHLRRVFMKINIIGIHLSRIESLPKQTNNEMPRRNIKKKIQRDIYVLRDDNDTMNF